MNPRLSKHDMLRLCIASQLRAAASAHRAQMYVMRGNVRHNFRLAAMWQSIARMHAAVALARLSQLVNPL